MLFDAATPVPAVLTSYCNFQTNGRQATLDMKEMVPEPTSYHEVNESKRFDLLDDATAREVKGMKVAKN